jgi:Holliday junction resolvasome RuvABC endonuclease subunit
VYISTQRLIKECPKKPDLVIFESFVGRGNTREVMGNMKLVLDEHKIGFTEVTSGHAKKNMTGKGNASKAEVIKAVNAKFGLDLKYKTRHEADAIAVAYTCEVMNEKS